MLPLPDADDAEFEYMANHYKLEGDSPLQLCRWNREVASLCGRTDEAQAWDLLHGLIDEFAPVKALFNEGIFSQPTDGFTPAQPTSPTGAPDRNHSPDYEAGIPIAPAEEDIVARENGSEESMSSRSSFEEDDASVAPQPKARFLSFNPPEIETVRPSAIRNVSSMVRGGSSGGGSRNPLQKRLTIETPRDDTPTPVADMDYPDPYGIAAALDAWSSGLGSVEPLGRGRITSRSTPHSTRPPSPTRLAKAGGSKPPSNLGSQRPSIDQTKERIQPGQLTRLSHSAYTPEQWDNYRTQRCAGLLDWWQAFITDGEVQVATALFVVGGTVIDFPRKQTLRVLESYLGELVWPSQQLTSDLLERYRLTVPMAYLRRFAGLVETQTVGAIEGITQIQYCMKCGKSTGSLEDAPGSRPFWWCRRCRQRAKTCAVW